ncbi:hypothetical protein COU76_00870 [Candidatus Peregrinibacteria bacterium CG10_big_fil_rev_8_21_14_0_10_49_10]|nr:MAG: hypothetical protein COU76_00870 [Candidatus Peregrinibacteria bacterium CG10_big_fil_rev_8_21_14_0_10_49_10]
MNLTLSWDLFVIVFFAVVVTYSFIIGKHESVKIIISTYIAIVAAQGMGNLIQRLTMESQPMLGMVGVTINIQLVAATKLILFIVTIVFLAIRGGFEIEYQKEVGSTMDVIMTALFGFVTAGLMLSTLMTFVADAPLLDKNIGTSPFVSSIVQHSTLMQLMVLYQDLWFALPAIILIAIGFMSSDSGAQA